MTKFIFILLAGLVAIPLFAIVVPEALTTERSETISEGKFADRREQIRVLESKTAQWDKLIDQLKDKEKRSIGSTNRELNQAIGNLEARLDLALEDIRTLSQDLSTLQDESWRHNKDKIDENLNKMDRIFDKSIK